MPPNPSPKRTGSREYDDYDEPRRNHSREYDEYNVPRKSNSREYYEYNVPRKSNSRDHDRHDDRYDEYDGYPPTRTQKEGGSCCSIPKMLVFFVFLGIAFGLIFGLVDLQEIEDLFSGIGGGGGGGGDTGGGGNNGGDTGGGGGDGGGNGNDDSAPYDFFQCPDSGACCNGLAENCDQKINEVLFANVHNANHDRLLFPNNEAPLEEALAAGYRSLSLDACMCPGENGGDELEFCHSLCGVGKRVPSEVFTNLNTFLNDNPSEIVMINFELSKNDPTSQDVWDEISQNNSLKKKTYLHPGGNDFPTMIELLGDGKQLVLFKHRGGDCSNSDNPGCNPRIIENFLYAVETDFDFNNVDEVLDSANSCVGQRGVGNGEVFYQINNFITGTTGPDKGGANVINEKSFLETRLEDCKKIMKRDASIISIDFWQRGDLIEVTQEENKKRARRRRERSRRLSWKSFFGW